jgi:hypothetical protein
MIKPSICEMTSLQTSLDVTKIQDPITPGPPIPIPTTHTTIADTGCTAHFFTIGAPYFNQRPAKTAINIQNPNGTMMHSDTIADIYLPGLPTSFPVNALQVYVVPDLRTKSLLSLGQLCDAGCTIILTSTTLKVMYEDTCILQGTRTPQTRLWHVEITTSPSHSAQQLQHTAYLAAGAATPAHLVAFHHAALGAPSISTLEKALRLNYITGFPGLTVDTLRKYPPTTSIPMIKGHLDQSRKNQRSTATSATATYIPYLPTEIPITPVTNLPMTDTLTPSHTIISTNDIHDDTFPASDPLNERTHNCFAAIFEPTSTIHTDLTGKFVAPSSQGNNYIFVLYDYDSNCILCEPIKNRTKQSILTAYQRLHTQLIHAGVRPKLQRLDNECSDILKEYMISQDIDYQLVPPHVHRRNAAERAIRTFKNHFVATLCSTDPAFPLYLWDRLLPQAIITLNLMRGSRMNPKLSAYAQIFGSFDYNRTPIAPPGTRAIIHDKPNTRDSWAPHGIDGWYIGPAMESYRCYTCWITETRRERICDTVAFLPVHVTLPVATANDMILASLRDIVHALNLPVHHAALTPPTITNTNRTALLQLQQLLDPTMSRPPPDDHTDIIHSPPLSQQVPTPQSGPTTLSQRVATPESIGAESPINIDSPPQRVPPFTLNTSTPTNVTTPDLVTIIDDDATIGDLPLVPILPTIQQPPPAATSVPEPRALPADNDNTLSPPLDPATFAAKTGPRARKTRRAARRQLQASATPIKRHRHRTRTSTGVALLPPTHHDSAQHASTDTDEYALHGNAFNPDTGKLAEYKELSQCSDGPYWIESECEEIGRLFQGYKHIQGTNTCIFIHKHDIPRNKRPTYLRIVAAHRPEKDNPFRIRWTCGGDRIVYEFDASTKTADLSTAKCLFNSVLSTPGGRFATTDLKDFFLGTPLVDFEYMRIPRHTVPDVIMNLYNLWTMVEKDGYLYVRIERGMYGLPHAGRIANDALIAHLAPYGYAPCLLTPGLWRHNIDDITFTLVVDDFGIKYTSRPEIDRFLSILQQKYEIKTDWTGTRYCGLTLDWDYTKRTLDISMPGYVERALQRFTHKPDPAQPSNSPHRYQVPTYGQRIQYAKPADTSAPLNAADKTRIQEVIGVFLYYARAVDNTMLPALGTIAQSQATPTRHTMNAIIQLLNYAAANPNAILRYVASDMILHVESDASYLSESKARSRYAGYHYLSAKPSATPDKDPIPPFNAAVHVPCQILREIVSSAAEAELAGLFHNAKEACPIRICLEELGHPQPSTPIVTDNSTAVGIATDTIKQKRSKAIDMRFYWIRDRVKQKQFQVLWRKGTLNKADYFTKHHPAKHHQAMRSTYLYVPGSTQNYFDCLSSDDDDAPDSLLPALPNTEQSNSTSAANATSQLSLPGEGVLKSCHAEPGHPGITACTALLTRVGITHRLTHNFM